MGMQIKNNWYVLQTKPQSEEKVCKQFANMQDERFKSERVEAFCPMIKCLKASRKASDCFRLKPLFPSYVFINWDLESAERHHLAKYTRGVNKILGDKERPIPVSKEIIDIIRGRENEDGFIEQKTFKVGDQVKVRRGHLRDLIGILERPVSDSGRVAVLLQLFNRQMRVHLNCADIIKA